jgi:hypothetical protein
MLWYFKSITILVKDLKIVENGSSNWILFYDDLFCYVEYSNVEMKLRSSILIIRSDAQNLIVKSCFGCRCYDLNYFEVGIFFHIPWIHYSLESIITNFVENHQFNVILLYFKQFLDNHLFNITYLLITCNVF